MTNEMRAEFGVPREWDHFAETHRLFLERFPSLRSALEIAFIRMGTTAESVDRVVFFTGRLCAEDFFEVLLLCGNGYGVGAMKILRGMYERVVTARYLHVHPEETESFLDFHCVSEYKLARAIREVFGTSALPKEKFEEVEANYQKVRDKFMVTDCKKCGTKRLNHTWSQLDLVSMARASGPTGDRIVDAYYVPTQYVHGTATAIFRRLEEREAGGLGFNPGPQRVEVRMALISAHNLILNIIDLQKEHFKLDELEKPLERCVQDFNDIWGRKDGTPNSGL